ncbi:MAG TPA: NAD(P)-dependent oxidoreductase [Chitinophagaceae bacterium]|nr:NAD(P)-dependent oxidoreductase [Chitinophagaceae bacterium]
MKTVLLAAPVSDAFRHWLQQEGFELFIYDFHNEIPYPRITGIITSNRLVLNVENLRHYSSLQWIARLGSGMEIIDTAYCAQTSIACFSSPAGIASSVAEHTIGMLLGLLHLIPKAMDEIRNGNWIREANRGLELGSRTIGIIGYGHTGSAFVEVLKAFHPRILIYDKYKSGFSFEASLEELKNEADIISFHVPLNDETRHYYNRSFMSEMKKKHILINTSRGAIAETQTILEGLQSGQISGACLDVLEEESRIGDVLKDPKNIVQQLLNYPVILTPHIAGYSMQAIDKMSEELRLQLAEYFTAGGIHPLKTLEE